MQNDDRRKDFVSVRPSVDPGARIASALRKPIWPPSSTSSRIVPLDRQITKTSAPLLTPSPNSETTTTDVKHSTSAHVVAENKEADLCCPLWTPWNWESFAPRARAYCDSVPSMKLSKDGNVLPVPDIDGRAPRGWAFEFQRRLGRSPEQLLNKSQADDCSTVVLDVLPNLPATHPDAWCPILQAQHTPIIVACALVIHKHAPNGQYRYFAETAVELKEHKIESLHALKSVLERASSIYTFNSLEVFTLLRCGGHETNDLRVDQLVNHADLRLLNHGLVDPLVPANDDPFTEPPFRMIATDNFARPIRNMYPGTIYIESRFMK